MYATFVDLTISNVYENVVQTFSNLQTLSLLFQKLFIPTCPKSLKLKPNHSPPRSSRNVTCNQAQNVAHEGRGESGRDQVLRPEGRQAQDIRGTRPRGNVITRLSGYGDAPGGGEGTQI